MDADESRPEDDRLRSCTGVFAGALTGEGAVSSSPSSPPRPHEPLPLEPLADVDAPRFGSSSSSSDRFGADGRAGAVVAGVVAAGLAGVVATVVVVFDPDPFDHEPEESSSPPAPPPEPFQPPPPEPLEAEPLAAEWSDAPHPPEPEGSSSPDGADGCGAGAGVEAVGVVGAGALVTVVRGPPSSSSSWAHAGVTPTAVTIAIAARQTGVARSWGMRTGRHNCPFWGPPVTFLTHVRHLSLGSRPGRNHARPRRVAEFAASAVPSAKETSPSCPASPL